MFCVTFNLSALNYTISFTSSLLAFTQSGYVVVQNLTQGTTVTIPANNTLTLAMTPSTFDSQINENENISISQSPESEITKVSFLAHNEGITQINIFSIDGQNIVSLNKKLSQGINNLELSLPKGLFILQIQGINFRYTEKIINSYAFKSKPTISFVGINNQQNLMPQKAKNEIESTVQMTYKTGDCLLYKVTWSTYSTIVTDVPTGSKTINFNFFSCKDADLNNYSCVTIGTQTWMVENLRTSKYSNGSTIQNVTSATIWPGLTTGAWCNFNNDVTNDSQYGKLYNWYAVNDPRNIAPVGWHVATDAEWTTLKNYVSSHLGTSISLAKALASTSNWLSDSSAGSIGNNLLINNYSGFSAIPGSGRSSTTGLFGLLGTGGIWWTSSTYSTSDPTGIAYFMNNNDNSIRSGGINRAGGWSVRCIKD